MKQRIQLIVNGDSHELYVDTRRSLLDVLRHELNLLGAHRGCDTGNCGACTVHVDGRVVTACMLMAVAMDGAAVTTVEGVGAVNGVGPGSPGVGLHPVQRALIEHGGIQCGFCTSGMIMSALALLQSNPRPSREQVRAGLAGNLCRCTGYVKIVDAVLAAAEELGA
ncbi:MAG: (2Fe-2S)-binding protein [Anaerolineales bacterium]